MTNEVNMIPLIKINKVPITDSKEMKFYELSDRIKNNPLKEV